MSETQTFKNRTCLKTRLVLKLDRIFPIGYMIIVRKPDANYFKYIKQSSLAQNSDLGQLGPNQMLHSCLKTGQLRFLETHCAHILFNLFSQLKILHKWHWGKGFHNCVAMCEGRMPCWNSAYYDSAFFRLKQLLFIIFKFPIAEIFFIFFNEK